MRLCLADGTRDRSTLLASSYISDNVVWMDKRRALARTEVRPVGCLNLNFSDVKPLDNISRQRCLDKLNWDWLSTTSRGKEGLIGHKRLKEPL
jgi:hypothetical protein